MQKKKIVELMNLVFKIAKKQNSTEYGSIMRYSRHIKKMYEELKNEEEDIRLEFATKSVEYSHPQTGMKSEYNIVPSSNEKKYAEALRKFGDEEIDISVDLPGYNLFLLELSKLPYEEIIKETKNEEGKNIPEFSYDSQLLIQELLEKDTKDSKEEVKKEVKKDIKK